MDPGGDLDGLNSNQSITERLGRLGKTSRSSQSRRLSDPSSLSNASASRSLPIRSKDGSRWLPTPDEQLHRIGGPGEGKHSISESVTTLSLSPHCCCAAVCAVLKAFETTELLESILCYLNTQDVLSSQLVSRRWRSAIQTSPYLRLHFFTYPQWERPGSKYQLLPINLPGVAIEEDEPIHLGQWIKVTLTPEAARRICPEPKQRVRARSIFEGLRGGLGRSSNDAWPASNATATGGGSLNYENLQITQPPLLGMQAYLIHYSGDWEAPSNTEQSPVPENWSDAEDPEPQHSAKAKLSCDSGITLGFLAETAQELTSARPSGPSNAMDVKVVFKAIVSFCDADATPRRSSRRNVRTVTRIP